MTPTAGGGDDDDDDDDTKSLAAHIQASTMVMHRDQVSNPSLPKIDVCSTPPPTLLSIYP
jgi:hypothetical protein